MSLHPERIRGPRLILASGILTALAATLAAQTPAGPPPHLTKSFRWARLSYACNSPKCTYYRNIPSWEHGYPTSERNLEQAVNSAFALNIQPEDAVLAISDPKLADYPIAYMVEGSFWQTTDAEATALGNYLRHGGFLIADDFRNDFYRGSGGWENFATNMARALPDLHFIDCTADMPIFQAYFPIGSFDEIPQDYDVGRPILRGLFEGNDPHKRMLAIADFNTDLSNYWEFEDVKRQSAATNAALKVGMNYVIYALSH